VGATCTGLSFYIFRKSSFSLSRDQLLQELISVINFTTKQNRVGLVEVLLGILDWRAGGRQGLCNQMKWNESEASIGRVLAVEVT
jgi:hypothetical protein